MTIEQLLNYCSDEPSRQSNAWVVFVLEGEQILHASNAHMDESDAHKADRYAEALPLLRRGLGVRTVTD